MDTFSSLESVKATSQGGVLTLGSFDGLHLGHRSLIGQVIETAKKMGVPPVVLTFDPHPTQILRPENAVQRLFTLQFLESELAKMGVHTFVVEPFTPALAQTSAADFMTKLVSFLKPKAVLVGYDFALGRSREGSIEVLRDLGKKMNFAVEKLPPLQTDGQVVSSTSIRQFVQTGDVEKAAASLGRPYHLEGLVEHGEGRGAQLGYPTLNMTAEAIGTSAILLATGVYVTKTSLVSKNSTAVKTWPGVTNVGHRPTFHSHSPITIETHLIGEKRDLYGERVRVEFLKRLRPELKFPSAQDLIQQIGQDVAQAKKFFGL